MDLYKEILVNALQAQDIHIVFPDLKINAAQIVEGTCYRKLQQIKAVIEDDSLDDQECFIKIEKIVCLLEEMGSDGGSRHNFG